MGDKFYAVAHGRKPGVYEEWAEAQKQIKDYPQPVYKKFATRGEAEEFVKARQHERVSMQVDESAKKFYAVARGKVIGIFTEFDEVKKHVEYGGAETGFMREVFRTVIVPFLPKSEYAWPESVESEKWTVLAYPLTIPNARVTGSSSKSRTKEHRKGFPLFFALPVSAELTPAIANYPQPMYKKFDDLAEAREYFKKYSSGEDTTGSLLTDLLKLLSLSQEKVYYAVARGHKPGVYETWAECQEQTKDFKGAKFKKFTEEEEAKLFAEGKTLKQIEERKRAHENDAEEEGTSKKKPIKEKLEA
uniref:ribonuclease H n=1 Tax=Ascaris lumbricoides TaxID=6252 RepID=A0A9J2PHI3_ASCLU